MFEKVEKREKNPLLDMGGLKPAAILINAYRSLPGGQDVFSLSFSCILYVHSLIAIIKLHKSEGTRQSVSHSNQQEGSLNKNCSNLLEVFRVVLKALFITHNQDNMETNFWSIYFVRKCEKAQTS